VTLRLAVVTAVFALLAVVPSGASASGVRACPAPTPQIAKLKAGGVSCTFAGYFAKGFAIGAEYAKRNPYEATYRGYGCSLAGSRSGRITVACTKGQARLRFVQAAPR
jgi:hypothetical protein